MSAPALRRARHRIRRGGREVVLVAGLASLLAVPLAVLAADAEGALPSGRFDDAGRLVDARTEHAAVLLPDGAVLVLGGTGGQGRGVLASVERWDADPGGFEPSGALAQARKWHTATSLGDGRVLVVGGLADESGNEEDFLASAELRDPLTGTFSATGGLAERRIEHTPYSRTGASSSWGASSAASRRSGRQRSGMRRAVRSCLPDRSSRLARTTRPRPCPMGA